MENACRLCRKKTSKVIIDEFSSCIRRCDMQKINERMKKLNCFLESNLSNMSSSNPWPSCPKLWTQLQQQTLMINTHHYNDERPTTSLICYADLKQNTHFLLTQKIKIQNNGFYFDWINLHKWFENMLVVWCAAMTKRGELTLKKKIGDVWYFSDCNKEKTQMDMNRNDLRQKQRVCKNRRLE